MEVDSERWPTGRFVRNWFAGGQSVELACVERGRKALTVGVNLSVICARQQRQNPLS